MTKAWWVKLAFLLAMIGTAVVHVYPTLGNVDLDKSRAWVKRKINLGLDLQGGLYLVMGIDFDKVLQEIVQRQSQGLESGLKDAGIAVRSVRFVKEGQPSDDPKIAVSFDASQRDGLREALRKSYWTLRLAEEKDGEFMLGLSREYRTEVRERTVNQSIEVIRNRIDEFGVSEPVISSRGNDRIVVELPGVRDIERAKELIGRTAKLEFRMVNDKDLDPGRLIALVAEIEQKHNIRFKEGQKFSEYVGRINEFAKGQIPAGHEIAFQREKSAVSGEFLENRTPYLLSAVSSVTGDDLQDANVVFRQEDNRPSVSFELNPRGASLFDKLTAESVGQRLAIVLDNIVHSAPVINGRIPNGRGEITLGLGNHDDLLREAKDLAIVLRAGALPAQLELLEQRSVGPSLGADSIRSGAIAGLIGCLAIFAFLIIYYRWSGVVATFSLILNALFSLAALVGLEATLTLPGIAGIALTIGMAVDSNVIIFERIRDELREGKSVSAAVSAGFQKAFTAIFDANITHGIVALILMTYGTGPVRGFAVTLLVGIFTTLFCAVTVCKLLFDGYLAAKSNRLERLSI